MLVVTTFTRLFCDKESIKFANRSYTSVQRSILIRTFRKNDRKNNLIADFETLEFSVILATREYDRFANRRPLRNKQVLSLRPGQSVPGRSAQVAARP
jgi:hypothetical protein